MAEGQNTELPAMVVLEAAITGAREEADDWRHRALDAAGMQAWDWNVRTGEVRWSNPSEAGDGAAPDALTATFDGFLNMLHPEDRERVRDTLLRAAEERSGYNITFRRLEAEGGERWVSLRGKAFGEAHGHAQRLAGVCLDATRTREMEQALSIGDRLFKILVENASDVIALHDQDLRFRYINLAPEKSLGVPRETFFGKTNAELGYPADPVARAQWEQALRQVLETGQETLIELVVPRSTGRICYQSRLSPNTDEEGRVAGVISISRDITALLDAQEAAHESERLLAATLRSIGDAVIATDAEGRVTFMNQIAEELTGWPEAEAIGRPCEEVFHIVNEATREEVESPVARVLQEGTIVGLANHTVLIARDGRERPIDDSGAPIADRHDNLLGAVLVFRDITERRRYVADLRYVLASAQCLLWYATAQYIREKDKIRWYLWPPDEEAARRFLPFPIAEGQTFAEAFYACRLEEDKGPSDRYGHQEVLAGRSYRQEYRCRLASGEVRWLAENVHVEAVAPDHWRCVGVCMDITELKQREQEIEALNERLRRSMQETHHRIKNSLQVIASLVEVQIEEGEERVSVTALQRIGQHVRVLAMIHDLLTYEAKTTGDALSLSAPDVLDSLIPLLQRTLGDRAIHYTVDDVRLSSRAAGAVALLTNEILSNAYKHGQGEIAVALTMEGERARLAVSDDGPGFPEGFDPVRSAHTGLDLVESVGRWDLQGEVAYENRPEGGARVVVTFPLRRHGKE